MPTDMLDRLSALETRLSALEEKVAQQAIYDAEVKIQIQQLSSEFVSLKTEVLETLRSHNEQTWQLIDKFWRYIILLLIALLGVSGIKILPDVLKLILGGN